MSKQYFPMQRPMIEDAFNKAQGVANFDPSKMPAPAGPPPGGGMLPAAAAEGAGWGALGTGAAALGAFLYPQTAHAPDNPPRSPVPPPQAPQGAPDVMAQLQAAQESADSVRQMYMPRGGSMSESLAKIRALESAQGPQQREQPRFYMPIKNVTSPLAPVPAPEDPRAAGRESERDRLRHEGDGVADANEKWGVDDSRVAARLKERKKLLGKEPPNLQDLIKLRESLKNQDPVND